MEGVIDVCFSVFAPTREEHWEDTDNPPMERGTEVILAPGIRVAHLSEDVEKRISEACHLSGYNVGRGTGPTLTCGIIRDDAPGDTWDSDEVISLILALTRIVHPSVHGTNASGTLRFDYAGELESIFPVDGLAAYKPPTLRPWLTARDWEDVGFLFRTYRALPVIPDPPPKDGRRPPLFPMERKKSVRRLPVRLHRALWNLTYAAFVEPAHLRWLMLATSLEGLIETGAAPRQEFLQRVPAIGDEVGVPTDRDMARAIYKTRCAVAHQGWLTIHVPAHDERTEANEGAYFRPSDWEQREREKRLDSEYVPLDRLLAGILRHAIADTAFRNAFDSKEEISRRWPVVVTERRCENCGEVIPRL